MVSAAANTLQHAAHPVSRQGGACFVHSAVLFLTYTESYRVLPSDDDN